MNNGSFDIICNADMRVGEMRQFCKLQDEGGDDSTQSFSECLSSHPETDAHHCADFAGSEEIQSTHLARALQYHPKIMMG